MSSARSIPASADRVPRDCLDRARAFRSRIEDADRVMHGILERAIAQIADRMRRHPVPRADTLAGIERMWRYSAPGLGRGALSIERERKSIGIVETRLTPSIYHGQTWADAVQEPGVTVAQIVLAIAPFKKPVLVVTNLAGVSLHALARRYQRKSGDTSDAAICADLYALGDAARALRQPARSSFDCPVSGGRWSGETTIAPTRIGVERILNARTFLYPKA